MESIKKCDKALFNTSSLLSEISNHFFKFKSLSRTKYLKIADKYLINEYEKVTIKPMPLHEWIKDLFGDL